MFNEEKHKTEKQKNTSSIRGRGESSPSVAATSALARARTTTASRGDSVSKPTGEMMQNIVSHRLNLLDQLCNLLISNNRIGGIKAALSHSPQQHYSEAFTFQPFS